jgi:lipopolysaccharide transport system ATP-binding protein
MSPVIKVENLGKRYRLGVINRQMLYLELQSWWARVRGQPDPNAPLIEKNPRRSGASEFWALQDVSFEVQEGDVVGILGRNGSGKSTLLKILSEITTPTTGRAMLKGSVASLLEVGTGFHPELTGRENVYLNGSILGMSRADIDAKYNEIAKFAGVEEFMDTPVKRYSSGMKLRLAFAVAAHLEPEILILDEVLAVGDADFQQKCLGRIGEVARGGRTILFVSHNMAAVQSLCNRGIVLDEGRVVYTGGAADAVSYYLHTINPAGGSLRERTDRSGSGDVRLVGLELRDMDGKPITSVWSGQDVDVCFFLENHTSNPFPKLHLDFVVKNQLELVVFKQHNKGQMERWGKLSRKAMAVCRVRNVPLPESVYQIDVRIRHDAMGQVMDQVSSALEFTVMGSDFFGPSDLSRSSKYACLVRGDWRLDSDFDSPSLASRSAEGGVKAV